MHVPNLAASLGSWSAGHRITAIAGWLALVIVTMVIGGAVGQVTMTRAEYGTGESGRAQSQLTSAGVAEPAQELVLVHSPTATAGGTEFRSAVAAVLTAANATGQVRDAKTSAVSASGHDVLLQFTMTGDAETAHLRVAPVMAAISRTQAAHPGVTLEEFGDASANRYFNNTVMKDFKRAEWTAVPLALGILLVVFGALLAAILPIVLALTAFFAASGVLALVSHVMHVDTSASSVMLLMGLAVGVDYCLFYLRREREERAAGRDRRTALQIAAATSGRSVLISGLTVVVAMAGMFLSGMQLFAGFAVATISVVLIAVAGSVTVLPALMSLLGDKVEFGRVPFLARARRPSGSGRVWNTVLRGVLGRPRTAALLAGGLLLALAAPAVGMRTQALSVEKILPSNTSIVVSYERIMAAFPGGPAPAVVVVKAPDIRAPQVQQAVAAFRAATGQSAEFGQPVQVTTYPKANLAEIRVALAGTGSDATSRRALHTLHDAIVPATLGKIAGGQALVGGALAASIDFDNQLRRGIVPVFLFVMGITFIVMLVAFGSVVIPATAIGLNLLSVGAAYGVMVAVFQHGWGTALIGTTAPGAIESWIPLFVFVVLFGLSMDYNVFVVSRIKEAHDGGLATRDAIAHGIRSTAGVVTSAAVIMVAVFTVFGTLSLQQFKQLSVGLAVAVLLDATVVRGVLLPSAMSMLGEHNWYVPRWLGWLPNANRSAPGDALSMPEHGSAAQPRPLAPDRPDDDDADPTRRRSTHSPADRSTSGRDGSGTNDASTEVKEFI